MALVVGGETRVGPYVLVRPLGRGGMAEVWLAHRRGPAGADKPCALKMPLPHLHRDATMSRLFVAEAKLGCRLRHAGLVGAFDFGHVDGRPYIAMEWVDGIDLARLYAHVAEQGRRLPVAVVTHVVAELLETLEYVHGFAIGGVPQGIVHRDISPHNVLLSAAGEVKLIDFGVARIRHEGVSLDGAKGKLRYMAPEQVDGRVGARSDLYAVGALLHEGLAGTRLRDGDSDAQLYAQIRSAQVPTVDRPLPSSLDALRRSLLAPAVGDRPASATAALRRLDPHLRGGEARRMLKALVRECLPSTVSTRASGLTLPEVSPAPPAAALDATTRRTLPEPNADTSTRTWPGAVPRGRAPRHPIAIAASLLGLCLTSDGLPPRPPPQVDGTTADETAGPKAGAPRATAGCRRRARSSARPWSSTPARR